MRFLPAFRALAIVSLITCCTLGLSAQDAQPPNQEDGACRNATTTSAMRVCENARYERAQRDLDSTYQHLLQRLDTAQKQKLRIAQRAWARFRDTNAEFVASLSEGGSIAPLVKIGTLTETTRERTAELKKATQP